MNKAKRAALKAAGYHFGTVAEFLGLTPEQEAQIEERIKIIRENPPYSKAVCFKCHKVVDTVFKKDVPFETEDVGTVIIDAYHCSECNELVSIPHSETPKLLAKRKGIKNVSD